MITSTAIASEQSIPLQAWLENPPPHSEWIDGKIVEKNNMTLKHSKIQAKLATLWRNYQNQHEYDGEVYTDVPCRTNKQGRSPDVAYLTPELVEQYGNEKVLPQSFPLTAEIISPTDLAEEVIAKAQEYIESGCQEVWLLFPENRWIIIITQQSRQIYISGETVSTQLILSGFSIAVDELLS
ncbi:protein of unknown function DUF820 [Gloeothece citriformis PCC 7424]|uniref:Putative restriction endonuclease domain-containing protein n=1 Tax=Gloeothece citriformis (strain PCC 7424) TaxID=65393 RepID=B7KGC5_GLOC7|nr:Uma2 family endonuclease [Gloeothece citriformis]ACK70596.1 protein of unknown function DUF820 [Gloeothece citriformis PCC 7424]